MEAFMELNTETAEANIIPELIEEQELTQDQRPQERKRMNLEKMLWKNHILDEIQQWRQILGTTEMNDYLDFEKVLETAHNIKVLETTHDLVVELPLLCLNWLVGQQWTVWNIRVALDPCKHRKSSDYKHICP
jgi:hypothetical protein